MSVEALSWVWDQRGLTNTERLVLLALASFADKNGLCWPSQLTIANRCEMRRNNVNATIRKLISKDLVHMSKRGRGKKYNLKIMGNGGYAKYLKSDHWRKGLRPQALERDGHTCQLCGKHKKRGLHVHHKFYRKGGIYETQLEDLITLCKVCHDKHHAEDNQ